MNNNIFQDFTGMGGTKVYTRYYGWGYRYDGSSFGYMPNGKIEKNDFINFSDVKQNFLNLQCEIFFYKNIVLLFSSFHTPNHLFIYGEYALLL